MASPESPAADGGQLAFALHPTDAIYRAEGDAAGEPVWSAGELLPFAPVSFDPAAAFLSYGLAIFEGLKAYRGADGRVRLFRPEENAARFRRSAAHLLLPPFPDERFVDAVSRVVDANRRFIPPAREGTLYLRPLELGSEPRLGAGPVSRATVLVYSSPAGPFFARPQGLRLRLLRQARVVAGGGAAKAAGNYAACMRAVHEWRGRGYDDLLFVDGRTLSSLAELSGANVFVLLRGDGPLVTPPLDGEVLAGVTRDSAMRLAREVLGLSVEERPISVAEVFAQAAEVFCTGTAYTIQSIGLLETDDGPPLALAASATATALREALLGIQLGEREDRFGWTRVV